MANWKQFLSFYFFSYPFLIAVLLLSCNFVCLSYPLLLLSTWLSSTWYYPCHTSSHLPLCFQIHFFFPACHIYCLCYSLTPLGIRSLVSQLSSTFPMEPFPFHCLLQLAPTPVYSSRIFLRLHAHSLPSWWKSEYS